MTYNPRYKTDGVAVKDDNSTVEIKVMYEPNFTLIEKATKYRETVPKDEVMKRLIKEFYIAVSLCKGPDIDRSFYWSTTARSLENKIRDRLLNQGVLI